MVIYTVAGAGVVSGVSCASRHSGQGRVGAVTAASVIDLLLFLLLVLLLLLLHYCIVSTPRLHSTVATLHF